MGLASGIFVNFSNMILITLAILGFCSPRGSLGVMAGLILATLRSFGSQDLDDAEFGKLPQKAERDPLWRLWF